jgi:AcrR family transcriptional regulator
MTVKSTRPTLRSGARRPRRGRDTRGQIVDAALRLFSERGYARTTVRDIAREVGITDAAIYYHFASKRDLLEALFEEKGIMPALQELERIPTDLPLRETLMGIARGAMVVMQASREFLRLVFMEALSGEPGALEVNRRVSERWERGLAGLLRAYMQAGDVRLVDADLAARQMISVVSGAFQDDLLGLYGPSNYEGGELSEALEAYLEASLDIMLCGLLPRSTVE